jgi:membrane-bound metal-dependent hydrolase YbcI (DUF457 family)
VDFFTHLLIGLLLASGPALYPTTVLVYGVVMAILPDFDILFFPLWKKHPALRHHGISHSLAFVLLAGPVGAVPLALLYPGGWPAFAAAGTLGGLSHVVADYLTSFAVPLWAPFSWKGWARNLELPVNPYTILASSLAVAGLSGLWLAAPGLFPATLWVAGALFLAYLGARALLKRSVRLRVPGFTRGVHDLEPTASPFVWYLRTRQEVRGTVVTRYEKLSSKAEPRGHVYYDLDRFPEVPDGPVGGPVDALLRTAKAATPLLEDRWSPDFLAAILETEGDGYAVFWFLWWRIFRSPTPGLLVRVGRGGEVSVTQARRVLSW